MKLNTLNNGRRTALIHKIKKSPYLEELVSRLQRDEKAWKFLDAVGLVNHAGYVNVTLAGEKLGFNSSYFAAKARSLIAELRIPDAHIITYKLGRNLTYYIKKLSAAKIIERVVRAQMVAGYGINDAPHETMNTDGTINPIYHCWADILERCQKTRTHERRPKYKNCTIAVD